MRMYKKKILSLLLTLSMLFGCFAGTGITAEAAPVVSTVTATPATLSSKGGIVTISVTGKEFGEKFYWKLRKQTGSRWELDGEEVNESPKSGDASEGTFEVIIRPNETSDAVSYEVWVQADAPSYSEWTNKYTWSGYQKATFTVAANEGGEVTEIDKTALAAAIEDAKTKSEDDYTKDTWDAMQEMLTAAENVNADSAATQDQVTTATENLQAAVQALEKKDPTGPAKITSVTATPNKIPSDGGTVQLKVTGENLTADNWGIDIARYLTDYPETGELKPDSKAGQAKITGMTESGATIEISPSGMRNNVDFRISVGPKVGDEITPPKVVTVTQERKSYSTKQIGVESVEMADDSTVIATLDTEVTAAKEAEALKKLIYIANADGDTNRHDLGEDDTVTVAGKKVTVKYAKPLANVGSSSKIFIKEGALQIVGEVGEAGEKIIAADIEWRIATSPTISSIKLDKEIFDSKGGTVAATLDGYRTTDIDDKKIEASVYLAGKTTPTDIKINKSRDAAGNPVLTFDVPENSTDNTISYWLNVKYNGAPVYGGSVDNRGDRASVSVLPKGKTEKDATLSAMTISGNNMDESDNITDISVNVSSNIGELKTELRIYGTNLDSKLTKVRAIDENGIVWPIYNISECDGTYRFVAIAGEHRNGVFGDGTSQLIEILPPRYIGFNKTYTIQVSIDGKNFLDAPSVKLTVKNEGIEGAVDCTSKNYKYVTVKYVEQGTGKELAPADSYKGYYYYMMKSFGIKPKEIPGYELVKGFEFTDDDYVYNGKTCTYEYKSTSPAVVAPGSGPSTSDPATVKVSSIKISGISKKLAAGKKVTLKAIVSPSEAANKAVTWKSSNKKYATVNASGKVTLKKAGAGKTVKITAIAKDGSGKKATYKIKIMKNAVKSVKLKAAKTVKAGKKITVKAKVKTTGKKANKKLKWTSSNTKYATVSSKGVVKAKKAGKGKTVKITAKATDGSNKKKTVKIKIK